MAVVEDKRAIIRIYEFTSALTCVFSSSDMYKVFQRSAKFCYENVNVRDIYRF